MALDAIVLGESETVEQVAESLQNIGVNVTRETYSFSGAVISSNLAHFDFGTSTLDNKPYDIVVVDVNEFIHKDDLEKLFAGLRKGDPLREHEYMKAALMALVQEKGFRFNSGFTRAIIINTAAQLGENITCYTTNQDDRLTKKQLRNIEDTVVRRRHNLTGYERLMTAISNIENVSLAEVSEFSIRDMLYEGLKYISMKIDEIKAATKDNPQLKAEYREFSSAARRVKNLRDELANPSADIDQDKVRKSIINLYSGFFNYLVTGEVFNANDFEKFKGKVRGIMEKAYTIAEKLLPDLKPDYAKTA